MGEGAPGRLPGEGFSHDQGRRALGRGSVAAGWTSRSGAWKTDRIDLVQHHEVIRLRRSAPDLETDGANAALLAPGRREALVHRLQWTQGSAVHLHMLEVAREHGFALDAVQMPLNVMDAHYRSFETSAAPESSSTASASWDEEPGERADPEIAGSPLSSACTTR